MRQKRLMCVLLLCLALTSLFAFPVYAAESAALCIEVEKQIDGDVASSAETFTFVLEAKGDAPMPEQNALAIIGEGKGSFPAIIYTCAGTYCYTIREADGNAVGYRYDSTVYEVTVQVTANIAGELTVSMWVSKEGKHRKEEVIRFTNQYSAPTLPPDNQTPEPLPTPTDPSLDDAPKTGDTSHTILWFYLMLFSLVGALISMLGIFVRSRQKSELDF